MQYAFFLRCRKGVFPYFLIHPGFSFGKNKLVQNRHYPLLLVIVYKASTGIRFIRSEEDYFGFVRNLRKDVVAFFEAAVFAGILLH
jgi:hypothetical protein